MGYSVSPSLTHNATVLTPAEVQLGELTPDRSCNAQRENFFSDNPRASWCLLRPFLRHAPLEKRFLSSRAPGWNEGSTRNNGSVWWSCLQARVYKQLLPRMLLTCSGKQKVKSLCYCKTQSYGWQERFGIQQGAPGQQCLVSVPIESLLTQVSFKSSQI